MSKEIYYFDNASSTRPTEDVLYDIDSALIRQWYNPSSNYEQGHKV